MKNYAEWEEEDVERLIADRVSEDFHLDYKKSDALLNNDTNKNSLGKDVSAFANSDGGLLIYGVEEENHLPKRIDGGLSPQQTTKEWIEQVIHGRIRRQVPNLLIKPIELKKSNPGHYVYLIHVPPSQHAPHMAHMNRYYRRNNFESVPMEEYEVRLLYLRGDAPDLTFELSLSKPQVELSWFESKPGVLARVGLMANVTNRVSQPALYTQVKLDVQSTLAVMALPPWVGPVGNASIKVDGNQVSANRYIFNRAAPNMLPIWDGTKFDFCDGGTFAIGVPYREQLRELFVIQWSITSPGMQMREGIEWLCREGSTLYFVPAE